VTIPRRPHPAKGCPKNEEYNECLLVRAAALGGEDGVDENERRGERRKRLRDEADGPRGKDRVSRPRAFDSDERQGEECDAGAKEMEAEKDLAAEAPKTAGRANETRGCETEPRQDVGDSPAAPTFFDEASEEDKTEGKDEIGGHEPAAAGSGKVTAQRAGPGVEVATHELQDESRRYKLEEPPAARRKGKTARALGPRGHQAFVGSRLVRAILPRAGDRGGAGEKRARMNESHIPNLRPGRRPLLTLLLLFLLGDWIGASIVLFLLLLPARVAAHTPPVWGNWAWWVILVTVLVVLWYGRGVRRLEHNGRRLPWEQKLFFSLGVFLGFAAASPPIDTLAGSLLFVHLTQHMLLHMFVPLLLCLGVPLAPLVAGLPEPLKRRVWRPLVRNRAVRAVWRALLSPFVASVQFVAVLYFWLLPPEMDLIAVHDTVDEFAHVTMLVSGLFFWWMILDPRSRPDAPSYPTRLLALTLTMFANIALGAYITLTHHDLYVVYNRLAAPWGISPMRDQRIGGLITWIDGSMMEVVGAMVVFHRWIRDESLRPLSMRARERRRTERQRARGEPVPGLPR